MERDDIQIGRKYVYDCDGARYFATIARKNGKDVYGKLGDIVNEDGDPGDPIYTRGTEGEIRLDPERLHEM